MIEGYMTVNETAEKRNITIRTVQSMCSKSRIKGAVKLGRVWVVPKDAEGSEEGKVITRSYKD